MERIKYYLLGLVLLFSISVQAQTWSEWFAQKKTQKKYLIEQMAALKLYAGYLKKGYDIGRSGLDFIKDAGNGEFHLHNDFFNSLRTVSPAIANQQKVVEIVTMQVQLIKTFSAILKTDGLSLSNSNYLEMVKKEVLNDCLADLEELMLVVTSGKLELPDEERLQRINRLYGSMEEKRSFAFSLQYSVNQLVMGRQRDLESLVKMEAWYEK